MSDQTPMSAEETAMSEPPEGDNVVRCMCGDRASCAIKATNIPSPRWQPNCQRCYHEFIENSSEVNDHEMKHFGGQYGLVTWEERGLEGAIQGDDWYLTYPPPAVHGEGETPRTRALLNRELAGEPVMIGDWTDLARKLERESADKDALIRGLREKIETLQEDMRDRDHTIRHLAKGVDFERKMPNETRPIIRAALRQAEQGGGA